MNLIKSNTRSVLVLQYDLEGNFIAKYPSITAAKKGAHVDFDTIKCIIETDESGKSKYLWKRVEV